MVNENINAQEWLDKKYPANGTCQRDNDSENKNKTRKGITRLDIRKGKVGSFLGGSKNLIESLKLERFNNLKALIISSHQLIELDVSGCPNLEELDCHNNELNSLNVNGCSKLKKINCSNNNLKELDLSTCNNLEEVNINNNPNLVEEKIKSNLIYDAENGKLVRNGSQIKNGPRITKAKEGDIRNILIIGITGSGKSALANTLTEMSAANKFGEKSDSISATKNFQPSDVFEYQGKKYRIIDNIGFGDTNNIYKDDDILFKIGEGISAAKEGINQILFVFKGKFSTEQVGNFNLFKDFIAETEIVRFTTLVRANFVNFKTRQECQVDKNNLLAQNQELKEIINSCNGIIYVDNPSTVIEEDSEDSEGEKEEKRKRSIRNEKKRKQSREKVLSHLADNCSEIYKLKNWDSIHQQVAKCMTKIRGDEEKLVNSKSDTEKTRLENEIKESKSKIAEEVNATLTAEISAFPKLTAQIEARNIHFSRFFNFGKK